jgi:phosphotransferase system IIA component
MAGALLGGLMGGTVAEAVVAPIKAEIYNIQKSNKKTAQALHSPSRSIDLLHIMVNTMNREIQVFREQYKHRNITEQGTL